jgi:hypothetical protein
MYIYIYLYIYVYIYIYTYKFKYICINIYTYFYTDGYDIRSSNDSDKRVVKIAAGSGTIGSHSLALTSDGSVYSWGVPHATGLGIHILSNQLI